MNHKKIFKFYIFFILVVLCGSFFALQYAKADTTPATTSTALNWSGYGVSGSGFTAINASWVLPQIAASDTLASDSTWVGIGGITNSDLIQIGTDAFSSGNQVSYQAFYEVLPQPSVIIPMTVSQGDSVTASIFETSTNQWDLLIRDNTTGKDFQTSISYTSTNSSAEWIEEMQSNDSNDFIPLDNFSPIGFSGCSIIQNNTTYNLLQSNAQIISMIDGSGQALTGVSDLSSDGTGFTVTRTSSTPVSSTTWQKSSSQREYRTGEGIKGYRHFQGNGNSSNENYRKCFRHIYVSGANFQSSSPYSNQ